MPRATIPAFPRNLLALAACAALSQQSSWALDLVQAPPLPVAKPTHVAPNVIISVDDSGSMNFCLNTENDKNCTSTVRNDLRTGSGTWQKPYKCKSPAEIDNNDNCIVWKDATDETEPVNGAWPETSRRINVLKHALKKVFNDKTKITEKNIRLGWQVMWNNGNAPGVGSINYVYTQYYTNGTVYKHHYTKGGASSINSGTNGVNSIKKLSDTHRANFISFVDSLTPENGTPSHLMFSQADNYMRRALDKNGPWANNPGGTTEENKDFLGCRRNYHIMMTDGRWNSISSGNNENGTARTLGDGKKIYDIASNQTQVHRDSYDQTLADWAFKSWAENLQPSGLKDADKLKPTKAYYEADEKEKFNTVELEKFWNPKYNPATWPHMVTYTIGFSNSAVTWPGASSIKKPTVTVPFGYDGSFPDLVSGALQWPAMGNEDVRSLDLWHAAINGRGRFYAVTKGEDLVTAFDEIVDQALKESAPLPPQITGGGSPSGYSVAQSNVGTFVSVYSPKQAWKGWVQASPVTDPVEVPCPTPTEPTKTCTKFKDPTSGWDKKTTADRLDALTDLDSRLIVSWSDTWDSINSNSKGGVSFNWDNLSTAQQALLGVASSTAGAKKGEIGANVVNYIRGDRNLEGVNPNGYTDDKPFRQRQSRQGDIVNSEIWYTGAPASNYALSGYGAFADTYKSRIPMLYVGGNDGMLHGFSAVDGNEKIAYIPRGVIGNLKSLTAKDYEHQYFVDGSPMTGDVKLSAGWATMLVGTLGAGGKGYFVIDVTDPSKFKTLSPSTLVKRDRTRGNKEAPPNCSAMSDTTQKAACVAAVDEDKDIGNIVAPPVRSPSNLQQSTQITRMNNDRWAVVMGNGYNSTNQRPVLLIQYLDRDMELRRIQTTNDAVGSGNANDNGLAAPALVDLNGDGRTDVVYAGDNLGNLWKFDLTSDDASKWDIAGWGIGLTKKDPLFTAQGPVKLGETRNQIQPITAPPVVSANDRQKTVGSGASKKNVAVGGLMVAFGTGRNLTATDRDTGSTQNVQTLYSVLDNTRYRITGTKRDRLEVHEGNCPGDDECIPVPAALGKGVTTAKLAKQTIDTVTGSYSTLVATEELKATTWKDHNGWYLDLPESGERLLKPMQFFDNTNILAVYSERPAGTKNETTNAETSESCSADSTSTTDGVQFRTLINIMDGKNPSVPLVDINGDNQYNAADKNVSRAKVNTGSPLLVSKGPRILDLTGRSNDKSAEKLNRMPEQSMRPSWRQLK